MGERERSGGLEGAAARGAGGGVVQAAGDGGRNPDGKVVGAVVSDRMGTEPPFEVYARVVMNTTGCFADQARPGRGEGGGLVLGRAVRHLSQPEAPDIIQPSSGAHVTLPGWYGGSNGMIIPKTKDGRIVFLLPFLGHTIAGTTDNPCAATPRPTASAAEVDFILETLSDHLAIQVVELMGTECGWDAQRREAMTASSTDFLNTFLPPAAAAAAAAAPAPAKAAAPAAVAAPTPAAAAAVAATRESGAPSTSVAPAGGRAAPAAEAAAVAVPADSNGGGGGGSSSGNG
ncbi:Glycerol-3-phosphate dehydrogenase SDP6, mitochondrial [Tetrabaena socialis]|uniref:glycerol-3-phosphate dehydrogenase n=1 Tax=Tetrabaena socialis TaxID=47790 RepID=A0A2J8A1E7_9CHLO|nr:Glycerol-3-phosphate dehydrogenase SDP6, mitochondrial [Tetrabaena socialis]|eukprot:PNH06349.1 Glycerol-3-phosphate dehydrogenase SDP6, mitochondrial [Tetrabaena socialis]